MASGLFTPPITFRGSECAYIVQIHALSTPEVQEESKVIPGGQEEGEHGVRFKGNINKESFKSLSSKREDMSPRVQ